MDIDFINEFISVQRKTLEELTSKHMIMETNKNIIERRLTDAVTKIEDLEKQILKAAKKGA